MRNRQPADQRENTGFSRTGPPLARSPAERLEPTRPPTRPRRSRRARGEREPRRSSPLLRILSGILTSVLLLMLLAGGIAYLFDQQIDAPGPLERAKVVAIPKNEGAHEIAYRLERDGVVSDRRLFIAGYLWAKLAAWFEGGKPVQLRAGEYPVRQNASIRQVIELLSEGRTIALKVTVPEGLTSHQIVERLKADANLSGEIEAVPTEGSLLPETFMVERGMSRQSIIERMQAEAKKLADRAWAQRKKGLPLKSLEEAIVLASIVEKETGRGDERERVAAVFINRLKSNMRLQSDPTILYGLGGGKTVWSRPIQKHEIVQKTTYNTYQIDGLPPTPICNPGRAAIEAVLNPADTNDLYFVADGAGRHVFAETLKEHNANVLKWRAFEKDKAKAAAPVEETPTTAAPPPKPKKRAVAPAKKDAAAADKAKEAAPAAALPWLAKPKP
jgi:peptidoglycan lytic transglycosylase G